ncbi:carboxypeptidase B-like isoform X1 [Aphidius gifuensis]|uniref:carboxypeptidase B-like isoform X1 n=1 Tax=Aphidius gifuensis TaxID=684658 RepID=UPI001CDBEF09|nr:carboxypeptidase B-like isoform X1 [Aphidius gifuensis]
MSSKLIFICTIILFKINFFMCSPLTEYNLTDHFVKNHQRKSKIILLPDDNLELSTDGFYNNKSMADDVDEPSEFNDEEIETDEMFDKEKNLSFKLFSSRYNKRGFSFTNLFESVLDVVADGFSSLVNNVIGEAKYSKTTGNRVSYKGHQVLRIHPMTPSQVDELREMRETETEDIKFWTEPSGNRTTDIVVAPDIIDDVKDFFRQKKIEYKVLLPDLQKTIAYQNPKMSKEQRDDLVTNQGHSMTWRRYQRFSEIMKYLEYLEMRYPNLIEVETIGHSYEGQPLRVVKVSTGKNEKTGESKPIVWIDAGMHAREWISTAVATYILNELTEKNSTYSKLLDTIDWMILPVSNPDGYEYSHVSDRLWRKTRSSYSDESDSSRYTPAGLLHLVTHYTKWFWGKCEGVDPNRNFDYHWGQDKIRNGASTDPCHETYEGPQAFSEPETKAMADYIMSNRNNIKLYLTLHSYNQMWLVPWGHTHTKPSDYSDLIRAAKKAAKSIHKVYGTSYKVGSSADLLYPTTGASDDWAKGKAGIKYSYTVELRDRGAYGFLLPATQIIPTSREIWAGIRTIARIVTTDI